MQWQHAERACGKQLKQITSTIEIYHTDRLLDVMKTLATVLLQLQLDKSCQTSFCPFLPMRDDVHDLTSSRQWLPLLSNLITSLINHKCIDLPNFSQSKSCNTMTGMVPNGICTGYNFYHKNLSKLFVKHNICSQAGSKCNYLSKTVCWQILGPSSLSMS